MAKSLAVKTGTALTIKEQENLVNGLLPKIPMFSSFQNQLSSRCVEDLDKNLHYEKCNRNGKTINYN
jgi:DNA mismatch repair protein MutL